MLGPAKLKFSGGDGSYCGVVWSEFGEDQIKTSPIMLGKKAKNGIWPEKLLEYQVPLGNTSLSWCVRLKIPKKIKNTKMVF